MTRHILRRLAAVDDGALRCVDGSDWRKDGEIAGRRTRSGAVVVGRQTAYLPGIPILTITLLLITFG
jgi:hypothetical protein